MQSVTAGLARQAFIAAMLGAFFAAALVGSGRPHDRDGDAKIKVEGPIAAESFVPQPAATAALASAMNAQGQYTPAPIACAIAAPLPRDAARPTFRSEAVPLVAPGAWQAPPVIGGSYATVKHAIVEPLRDHGVRLTL